MTYRWRSATLLPLLIGLLASCEPVAEHARDLPTAPESALQSQSSDETRTVTDDAGNTYTVVEGRIPSTVETLHTSKVIGLEGGAVHLAGHTLTVPAGAVDAPTLFVLSLLPSGYVEVELLALAADPLAGVVDVGEEGFAKPVTLSLTYAWAEDVADPSRLRILHLRDDGMAEPIPTTLRENGKTIAAQLHHFSKYCMASN